MIKWEPFFFDDIPSDDCTECAILSDNKLYCWSFCDFWDLWASVEIFDYKIEWDEIMLKCTDFINCYEKNQDKYYYNKPDDYVDEYLFSYQIKNWQPKWISIVMVKSKYISEKEAYVWVNTLYKKIKWRRFNLNIWVKAYMFYKVLWKEKSQKHINKIISDLQSFKNEIEELYNRYGAKLIRHKSSWNEAEDGYHFSEKLSKEKFNQMRKEEDTIIEKYNMSDETLWSYYFIMKQLKSLLDGVIDPEWNHCVSCDKEMFEAYNKEEQKRLS